MASQSQNFKVSLGNLPVYAKLNTESTDSKLAKCIWDNPEWNEHSSKADKNPAKGSMLKLSQF